MKRHLAAGVVLLVSVLALVGAEPETGAVNANRLQGTWEQIYDGPRQLKQIKIINEDHFVWVTYDVLSKVAVATAGGTYTLDGDTYKEQIEFGRFGTPALQKLVGTEQTFKVEIDGDQLIQTGTLSDGTKLRETMTRSSRTRP